MIKTNRCILVVALAAAGLSSFAYAQSQSVTGYNTVAPGVVAKAPAAIVTQMQRATPSAGLAPTRVAPSATLAPSSGSNLMVSPAATVSAPVMMDPMSALGAAPASEHGKPAEGDEDQQHYLREINKARAKLEYLKLKGDLMKAQEPLRMAEQKDTANALQSQLETVKASEPKSAPVIVAAPVPELTVTVLMTYGMDGKQFAEIRVGDLVDTFSVGDKLPSGHTVKAISHSAVTLVKGRRGKSEVVRVSRSAASEVYGSRAKSGVMPEAAPAAGAAGPAALPATLSGSGQSMINQLMRQNPGSNAGAPPFPGAR